MSVRVGAGISTTPDPLTGATEAAGQAAAGLDGRPADLALVFAGGAHLAAPEATLEGVHEAIRPGSLIGCGAGGRARRRRGAGRRSWSQAPRWRCGRRRWTAARRIPSKPRWWATTRIRRWRACRELEGDSGVIMLSDPYSLPDRCRARRSWPSGARACRCSAACRAPAPSTGAAALFLGDEVLDDGRGRRAASTASRCCRASRRAPRRSGAS